eukprot:gene12739-6931_t
MDLIKALPIILRDPNGVFTYNERIKWLIFDKGKIGWKHIMKDVYEFPIILSFRENTHELEKVIKLIQEDININVEIVATYGTIPKINIK